MSSYRGAYEWTLETWKHQREDARNLADKARGFIVVVGLVFGYSVFNASTLLTSLRSAAASDSLSKVTVGLFGLYYLCFAVALLLSLLSLRVSPLSHPHLVLTEPLKAGGPTQADLDEFYYTLAGSIRQCIETNEPGMVRQASFLVLAHRLLVVGGVSLVLAGGLFAWIAALR